MDDGIPFLPEGIIRNILKRLPVKSLMRFRCVCRRWRILFKTKSFIADHLDYSSHQNPCLLLQHFGRDDPLNLYCLDSDMQFWKFQNPPLLNYMRYSRIIGSCNGLLCVQIDRYDVSPPFLLVWNPAIKEVRLVPETHFCNAYTCYLGGFGFSPISNDYKIVIPNFPGLYCKYRSAVKVYSLSSGSWKEVKLRLNASVCLNPRSVTINGIMFWLASKIVGEDTDDDVENLIVSLDLAVEVFTVIPIPELQPIKLTVYEEKLAIFSWNENSEHSAFDIWVMEEGVGASGERWSWTKQYTSPDPCFLNPTTIWKNEIVCRFHVDEESAVVLFNPSTETIQKFAITKSDYRDWMFNYAESLVPVGGMRSSTNFL